MFHLAERLSVGAERSEVIPPRLVRLGLRFRIFKYVAAYSKTCSDFPFSHSGG